MAKLNESSIIKIYCPFEQKWTVTEDKLNRLTGNFFNDDDEEVEMIAELNSDAIEISTMPSVKHSLHLICRSNGIRDFFSLFLYVITNETEKYRIHGKYAYSIKSANFYTQFDNIFDGIKYNNNNWGDDICPVEEIFDPKRNFFVDGKVEIEVKGFFIFEFNEMPKICDGPGPLSQGLWEREDKDFEIFVKNEGKIMAHKNVLATRSSVFNTMLNTKMEEALTNTLKIIDFNLSIVTAAIEFFYDRDIFKDLTFDNAFELLRFSDKYNVIDLKDKLDTYFSYHLSPITVCQLANDSIKAGYTKLQQICAYFLMICLRHSIPIEDIDSLDKEFAAELFRKAFISSS